MWRKYLFFGTHIILWKGENEKIPVDIEKYTRTRL